MNAQNQGAASTTIDSLYRKFEASDQYNLMNMFKRILDVNPNYLTDNLRLVADIHDHTEALELVLNLANGKQQLREKYLHRIIEFIANVMADINSSAQRRIVTIANRDRLQKFLTENHITEELA